MSFWTWFTGSKTAEKALDVGDNLINKVAGGLDQLFFTDQEKAQVSVEAMQLHLALVKTTQEESQTRSVTRRVLSWLIMGTFMLLIVFATFIWRANQEWAKWTLGIIKQFYELVLMVGFFYYGYYAVSSIIKTKNGQ